MEYLVPILIFAGVGVIGWVIARFAIRAARNSDTSSTSAGGTRPRRRMADRVSAEAAYEASARLDEESHRGVYQHLAAGRASDAALLYRQATGLGVMDSMFDIQSLAAFPQEWSPLKAAAEPDAGSVSEKSVQRIPAFEPRSPDEPVDVTDLTVPLDWPGEDPIPDRAFHVEVVREEGTVRLSSDDLPAWLKDQLSAMIRDYRIDEGADLLAEHSVLTPNESLDLLRIIAQEHHKSDDE